MLKDISPDEFFPVIRQALMDAYNIDSFLMKPPYGDIDLTDGGIRKLIWGKYNFAMPQFPEGEGDAHRCVLVESRLGFSNMAFTLSREKTPPVICLGAFLEKPLTGADIARIMRENNIPKDLVPILIKTYDSLPVAHYRDIGVFAGHMIHAFLPDFTFSDVNRLNFTDTKAPEAAVNLEEMQSFNAENASQMSRRLNECGRAVLEGNARRAVAAMKSVIDYPLGYERHILLQEMRTDILQINMFFFSRILETSIHPQNAAEIYRMIERKVYETDTARELEALTFEIVRRYANLVKNFSDEEYSYLIRDIRNYIDLHISGDLSLSAVADHFGKNPSYLSARFSKETGMTLSEYVSKRRIDEAVRYFNTTSMSVSEVALAVGISDFSYFSRQFKKYAGLSPREYKKKLTK